MARHELLDNLTHADLRVVMRFGAQYGDEVGLVPAFVTEFAELLREYPIFLRRTGDDGALEAVALLGFAADENLFVADGRWHAGYLPGYVARGPFLIGFQDGVRDGLPVREPVVHVDVEHPRISRSEGEAVFLPQGGHAPLLRHAIDVLRGVHEGAQAGQAMFAAFDALGLVQPMRIDVMLDDAHRINVEGLLAIDRERLDALDAEALHGLHRAGYLEGAYLMLSSLHNVRRLMAEKQRRLRAAQPAAAAPAEAPPAEASTAFVGGHG